MSPDLARRVAEQNRHDSAQPKKPRTDDPARTTRPNRRTR